MNQIKSNCTLCLVYAVCVGPYFYIGSTAAPYRRLHDHKSKLKHGKHRNRRLQACYDKYRCFEFVVLDVVAASDLFNREQAYLDVLFSDEHCLNLSRFAVQIGEAASRARSIPVRVAHKDGSVVVVPSARQAAKLLEVPQPTLAGWLLGKYPQPKDQPRYAGTPLDGVAVSYV